jgi:hypothetical protein
MVNRYVRSGNDRAVCSAVYGSVAERPDGGEEVVLNLVRSLYHTICPVTYQVPS